METTPKTMLAIFAFIVGFAYFAITEFNKESALTKLQGTRSESEGLARVLADRRQLLKQKQDLLTTARSRKKLMTETKSKLENLLALEEKERATIRSAQTKIHKTHQQYIAAVRETVEKCVGTQTPSIRLITGKTMSNLTLTAATEEALTFTHDAGITKVMNADLSNESRALFGLPDQRELSQILEIASQDSPAEQKTGAVTVPATSPAMAGGTTDKTVSNDQIASLEKQLADVQTQRDELLNSAQALPGNAKGFSVKSRETIAEKLKERMLELEQLIKNAKEHP